MLTITICDDACINCDMLYELIRRYVSRHEQNTLIKTYNDPLEVYNESNPSNIYVLDMIMPGLTGRELAIRLHEKYPQSQFIFISADAMTLKDSYDAEHIAYLLKPVDYKYLAAALDKAIEELRTEIFVVHTPDGDKQLRYKDLVYAQNVDRAIEYHMTNGDVVRTVCVRGKVKDAYGPVAEHDGFMFLAPSTVINLAKVELVNPEYVEFGDGSKLFYTHKYHKELRKRWGEAIGEGMSGAENGFY